MSSNDLLKWMGVLAILSAGPPALASDVSMDAAEARAAEGSPAYLRALAGTEDMPVVREASAAASPGCRAAPPSRAARPGVGSAPACSAARTVPAPDHR